MIAGLTKERAKVVADLEAAINDDFAEWPVAHCEVITGEGWTGFHLLDIDDPEHPIEVAWTTIPHGVEYIAIEAARAVVLELVDAA